jgi:hypothetical protein
MRARRVDGSTAKYNLVDIRDLHNVIDWFPQDHPTMPPIIEHGPAAMGDSARGCGRAICQTDGGGPRTRRQVGCPSGISYDRSTTFARGCAVPERQKGMAPIAGRIIEMPEDEEQGDTLRNPRSGFLAYVPPGSIKRGEDLVTTGGMKIVHPATSSVNCGICSRALAMAPKRN